MFQLHPQLCSDTLPLGQLPLCRVLLMNDSHFPWLILVPQRAGVREVYQLEVQDQLALQNESVAISSTLMLHYKGDKLNIGALGNLVPQLHIHHIVRYQSDAAWPKPVWGAVTANPYSDAQLDRLIPTIQALLVENIPEFRPC